MYRTDLADVAAVGVSVSCLAHCLAVPLLLVAAPWVVPEFFEDERFHVFAVLAAIPLSALALARSFRARPILPVLAVAAVVVLIAATQAPSEEIERGMTVVGACLLAGVHFFNLRWRRAERHTAALEIG